MNENTLKAKIRKYASLACDGMLNDIDLEELQQLLLSSEAHIEDYASFIATDALIEIASGKNFLQLHTTTSAEKISSVGNNTGLLVNDDTYAAPLRTSQEANAKRELARSNLGKVTGKYIPTRDAAKGSGLWSHFNNHIKHYALAATVLLGLFLWTVSKPFAQIVAMEDVSWAQNYTYQVGGSVRNDWIEIDEGVANLVFGKGAMASLQGPAKFRATSSNNAYLEYGVLTIQTPESAHGFKVSTPKLSVVDLGTGFRLQVERDKDSSLHVTEGLVELRKVNNSKKVHLNAGDIATIDSVTEKITLTKAPTLQSSKQVQLIQEHPASLAYGKYDHDNKIVVFLESYKQRLTKAIRVNLSKPGRHDWFEDATLRIEPGVVISSYLIHCAPYSKRHVVEGQVTFPGKIIGVIGNSDSLNATNSILGAGWTLQCAHPERGVESIPDRNSDVLTISRDQRTLSLLLKTESIDQLRVLVSEN